MSEYLPEVYRGFRTRYPQVAEALDRLGAATEAAGPRWTAGPRGW
ncbi:MAG: hypothetical protein RMM30_07560 [Armatimonadota bacterium]|nr:hypothetical protein [Armatimonadota bacterium]MDW8156422.1 hypothetical protein [Armatimonadota bacterium]